MDIKALPVECQVEEAVRAYRENQERHRELGLALVTSYQFPHLAGVIANAHLALLDRQAAEAAERAKPIDDEWLAENGFSKRSDGDWTIVDWGIAVRLTVADDASFTVVINSEIVIYNYKTHGEVLDLLRGLKINQ